MKEITAFWGIALTGVSGVYLLRPQVCKRVLSMMEDPSFVIVSAWFSVVLGALSIAFGGDGLEMGIGGVFLLTGLYRLAFPERVGGLARTFKERPYIPLMISFISFLVGLFLLKRAYGGV
ncbi:hypothetical protein [Thermovibrio ammonificans]|uniref:Uncharacterized protein n=1 Tax=Thermovibrio ammonificans (strain DSM 15698 / JCM 12110 / HB-1) TaxID=648996 RepID=E8T2X9_THEA1|nr:hypothetical protein [Thermovibrio ammonificans]ADU97188.1 hypothetical protein Theam_1224 [Thermovibrio ammonificans HB-1]